MGSEPYEVFVQYSHDHADSVARCFWHWRKLRNADFFMMLMLALSCVLPIIEQREPHVFAAVVICAACVALYWLARLRSYQKLQKRIRIHFKKMSEPQVKFTFTDDQILLSPSSGQSLWSWKTVAEVWISSQVILLFAGDKHYIVLPVSEVRKDVRALIMNHIIAEKIPVKVWD
jgi:hypothetical protein